MNSQRRRNDGFHENSIGQVFKSPIRFLKHQMRRLFGESESLRTRRSPLEVFVSIVTLPFRFCYACIVFMVQAWTTSRNGFAFVRSLPAILAATVVFAAIWAINFRYDISVIRTRQRYELALIEDRDHPEYAEMYAEKLVEMSPDDAENKFLLAESKERVGKIAGARTLMTQLSNDETDIGSKAHIWLARNYTAEGDISGMTDEERERLAIEHYNLALNSEANRWLAYLGLADIYDQRDDKEKAAEYLAKVFDSGIVSTRQVANIPRLIVMQQELGKEELAKQMVEKSIKQVSGFAQRNTDMIGLWEILVRCATLLNDYDQAYRIIETADQTVKDPAVRAQLAIIRSTVAISQADSYESIEDKASFQGRLVALCSAIEAYPKSPDAYSRLIDYVNPKTLQDEKAIWLRDSIVGSSNPAVIHIVLGMQDILNGNFVQGQKHWRIAQQQFTLTQYLVHFMIEQAVAKNSEDFGNIMDMITVAMELFPDQVLFYQTRGRYYMEQEQFPEAIENFNFVIKENSDSLDAQQLLRECYLATNESEKAKQPEGEIERLLNRIEEPRRALVKALLDKRSLDAAEKAKKKQESQTESKD